MYYVSENGNEINVMQFQIYDVISIKVVKLQCTSMKLQKKRNKKSGKIGLEIVSHKVKFSKESKLVQTQASQFCRAIMIPSVLIT